jgi:hypothetical protein
LAGRLIYIAGPSLNQSRPMAKKILDSDSLNVKGIHNEGSFPENKYERCYRGDSLGNGCSGLRPRYHVKRRRG